MIYAKYELTDNEYAILERQSVSTLYSKSWMIVMNALGALMLVSGALVAEVRGHRSWENLYFGMMGVYLGTLVVAGLVGRGRSKRVDQDFDLLFDESGVRGSIGGRAFAAPWKTIDSATDVDAVLMLKLRGRPGTLGIPKRALQDANVLWSLIRDRLTAKRGLIARPDRTFIVNTTRV